MCSTLDLMISLLQGRDGYMLLPKEDHKGVVIELGHSSLVGYMDNLTFACVKV